MKKILLIASIGLLLSSNLFCKMNDDETKLFELSKKGAYKSTKMYEEAEGLIKKGVNVDRTDPYGETALHQAASSASLSINNFKFFKLIAENSKNFNPLDRKDQTPIEMVREMFDKELIIPVYLYFLNKGAAIRDSANLRKEFFGPAYILYKLQDDPEARKFISNIKLYNNLQASDLYNTYKKLENIKVYKHKK